MHRQNNLANSPLQVSHTQRLQTLIKLTIEHSTTCDSRINLNYINIAYVVFLAIKFQVVSITHTTRITAVNPDQ